MTISSTTTERLNPQRTTSTEQTRTYASYSDMLKDCYTFIKGWNDWVKNPMPAPMVDANKEKVVKEKSEHVKYTSVNPFYG